MATTYNQKKRWSELINFDFLIQGKEIKEYQSEEELIEDVDINSINFSLDNEKILNEIEKILKNDNYENETSLEVLKQQDLVTSYLSKGIQNNNSNKEFFLKILCWLQKTSLNLSNRLKLKIFYHNENFIKKDKIIRSSYKFCGYKHNCSYNYDTKKKGCYADHFVHNMIHADVCALIKCINEYYEDNEKIHNKELVKCINTISYVIKHMYEELNNLCLYSEPSEHESFHVIKNNVKKYNNTKRRNINI